jgi:hypothetical protein
LLTVNNEVVCRSPGRRLAQILENNCTQEFRFVVTLSVLKIVKEAVKFLLSPHVVALEYRRLVPDSLAEYMLR